MVAGRVRIVDLIDADAGSPRYCGHSIGRVIEVPSNVGSRWVRIDRIERSGDHVYGVGVCVTATQAVTLQMRWDVRWGLRCAPNQAPPAAERRPPSGPLQARKFGDVDGAAAAIVSAGYRALAKKFHPDAGGDHSSMSLLTQAHKQLKQILDMARGGTS